MSIAQSKSGLPVILRIYRWARCPPDSWRKGLVERRLRKLLFRSQTWPLDDGIRMRLGPVEWTQVTLLCKGCLEPLTVALFKRLLKSGDTCVDVGAHIGFHTMVAARIVGAHGRVVAIEPQPQNCADLLDNSKINKFENILLVVAAVGDHNGQVSLAVQSAGDRSLLSLAIPSRTDLPQRFSVPILRLDGIFAEQKLADVALLKIDVEGYELEVLHGLGAALGQVRHLILEVLGTPDRLTERAHILLAELRRRGLRFRDVLGEPWHEDRPLPENNLWVSAE